MNSDSMFSRCDSDELHINKKQKLEVNQFSEFRRRNLSIFTLIWCCDTDIILNKQHEQTQIKLRESINFIVLFNNTTECEKYIQQIKDEKIILIISYKTARELLLNIHDLEQVIHIYVYNYYTNKEEHNDKLWVGSYQKVKAVLITPSELINRIAQDQIKREKNERTISTTIFSPILSQKDNKTNEKERTHNKLNGGFLWSRLFIEALIKLEGEYLVTSLDEFIDLCYQQYDGNAAQYTKISEFKRTYKSSDAIWWYTKEPFVYELLNKALRIQDFDIIFKFRFLIHDICVQLDTEQLNQYLELDKDPLELLSKKVIYSWRGQRMSVEEFEKLRHSEGQFITMNSFLSTSRNKQVARMFDESIDNKISVLFHMESDICTILSKPFADICHLSSISDEEEILFMAGVIFKIMKVYYDDKDDHVWIIKLLLYDERNTDLHNILRELIHELLPIKTNFMSIGNLLMHMGQYDKAEQYYQRHLKTLSCDDTASIIQVYLQLTFLAEAQQDRHRAINHWKTATDMITNHSPSIDTCLQDTFYSFYNYLSHRCQPSDYDKIFQFIQQNHLDRLATVGHNDLNTADSYGLIGYVSQAQGKFDDSLESHNKALEIRLKLLPENHPTLGKSYEAIGDLYAFKKDYSSALGSYQKALKIKSTSLPDNHADIIKLEHNIADIHEQHMKN